MKRQIANVCLVTLVSLLAAGATACGKPTLVSRLSAPPTEISIMTTYYTPKPPAADNVIVQEIERRTNTKLDITWVSPNNYQDKMNVTLASGTIPDLMLIPHPSDPTVVSMCLQGDFWDLTNRIKQYPNLTAFPKESWLYTRSPDGKNYGIPRVRPEEGAELVQFRQDWLDKLGLKKPETLADVYTVMQAFAAQDPDGNGQNDTYGFIGSVNSTDLGGYSFAEKTLNGTPGWKEIDGKLVPPEFLPGTRAALLWMNNAYKERLIPSDFALLKATQAKDMMKSGQAGAFVEALATSWEVTAELRKSNPTADVVAVPYISGPNGKYALKASPYYGEYVIPKRVSEDKLNKLLQFMDYGSTAEGSDLAWYGLPGVHYTEQDGMKITNDQAIKDVVAQQAFGQIFGKYDKYQRAYSSNIPFDLFVRNKQIIDESAAVSVPEPRFGLTSDTASRVSQEYDSKTTALKIRIIMGNEPITAWDDYVNQLKADPVFQKITDEYNAAYQQRNNSR